MTSGETDCSGRVMQAFEHFRNVDSLASDLETLAGGTAGLAWPPIVDIVGGFGGEIGSEGNDEMLR